MTARRYLALDLGCYTGYALAEGNKIVRSGVRDFSTKKTQHIGQRFAMFYNFLAGLGQIDEIYYEKIMFTGGRKGGGTWTGDHGELYHGLLAVMNMVAAGYAIPTIGVWPGTLKKAFTGSGVAEKKDMCTAARAIGWLGGQEGTEEGNDEADAIGLIVTQLRDRYGMDARFTV